MDSQLLRTLSGNFGALRAIVTITVVVMVALISSGDVRAAQGECRWEGGPGESGGYAYCAAEDCIGNGGLAQCSAGEGRPYGQFTPEQAGPEAWVYYMCDEGATYMSNIARWCSSAGGEWVGGYPPRCENLPPDILGGAGTVTNDESRAVSISDTWVRKNCGVASDTDWGADIQSNWCWSGTTETKFGLEIRGACK